ncbi:MAG: hypothetical protein GXP26_07120 [Planctomycetes bacterium]|nr:hypothetical protein [Planctomycetota bacterium]
MALNFQLDQEFLHPNSHLFGVKMSEGFATAAAGAASKWAWDNYDKIKERLNAITRWFRKSDEDGAIYIFGAGGVGKTTLARLLSGDQDYLFNPPGNYVESLTVENYSLGDSTSVELLVPPGQKHRRDDTWGTLESNIAGGKCRGFILIVSYGYHSIGSFDLELHRLWQDGDDLESFLPRYLEEQRKDEIEVLKRISSSISLAQNKMWLLVLVTKEDLWFNNQRQCQEHYCRGEFATHLNKLGQKRDSRTFRQEIAFGSLVIKNYVTSSGELMQKNLAGYDHDLQVKSIRDILETCDSLREWEEGET